MYRQTLTEAQAFSKLCGLNVRRGTGSIFGQCHDSEVIRGEFIFAQR
jgi:hypothetical protein